MSLSIAEPADGLSGLLVSVRGMAENATVTQCFERYTQALSARDPHQAARLYAVPALA